MRFEEKEDCYFDTITGLEWSKENLGPISWYDAMANLLKEWRIPTIKELLTLTDYKKYNPATDIPDIMTLNYWSSTTYARYPDIAWVVNFNYGSCRWDYKSYNHYVRVVKNQSAFLPDGPDFSIP